MLNSPFTLAAVLGAMYGLVVCPPVFAASETGYELDQIIVTGSRTSLNVDRIGNATTIITREQIERRQMRYVTDLLRSVPGFSVSHSGGIGSQTQVRVRGSEANHVLVLIDGVRANDPATGDEFRWEYLTTGNIERVEIVRGPQSTLWGSDAVAAVVHVITISDGRPGLDGYAEGGSDGTANIGMNGALNGSAWSLTGGIERLDTDGENISRMGSEQDGSDITTVTLAGHYSPTDALTFRSSLRVVDAYSEFDPVDFFTTGLPTDGDLATATENLSAEFSSTLQTLRGRISHRLYARYFESDNQNLTNGSGDSSNASDRTTVGLQSDIGFGLNRLSLAIEHEDTGYQQRGPIVFGDPNQDQSMESTSVVAEYQYLAGERITWLLSARQDDNSDFADITTGRLSLAYRWSDQLILRGSIGTGQKNPTFTERFGFFPGQFVGNPALKPERSTAYDIGLDSELLDGSLVVQATLFQQDLEDEINGFVFDPASFLFTAQNIDGRSKRRGAEITARWQATNQIGVSASYTNTDTTEKDFSGANVRELRRPRHSGSLSIDFQSIDQKFDATLVADYGGDRSDIFFPPFPAFSEIVTLESYWLVDLTVQYHLNRRLSLFVRVANLLDEDYEQVFGYRTLGRTGYVGIRAGLGNPN
jgi:vitamin B12 transporter